MQQPICRTLFKIRCPQALSQEVLEGSPEMSGPSSAPPASSTLPRRRLPRRTTLMALTSWYVAILKSQPIITSTISSSVHRSLLVDALLPDGISGFGAIRSKVEKTAQNVSRLDDNPCFILISFKQF